MRNVTPKERRIAKLVDSDQAYYVAQGVRAASQIGWKAQQEVLRAYRAGHDPMSVLRKRLDDILPLLADGMVTAYLFGMRRAILLTPVSQHELSLSTYSKAVNWMTKRMKVKAADLRAYRDRMGVEAVRVTRAASHAAERRIQGALAHSARLGMHTREGVKELKTAFANAGITPQNSGTLETLFRTQTQLAYSAGRYEEEQDPDIQEILWGYKYVTVGDDRVRDTHAGLER
ncbi:unnamed protein product, partial [marine sediment metagenome]